MKEYQNILTKEKYELKIEEEINRMLYEKKYITYETYVNVNNDILKQIKKRD